MNRKNRQKIRMDLETETPLKVNQEFHILATAVATQGNQILEGEMVQFFLNNIEIGSPVQTDPNGRAQYNVIGIPLNAKIITIEAQLIGQAARARRVVILPSEEKKKPSDLEIKTTGKNGKYFVNATIISEDRTGMKGTIRILTDESVRDFPSNEKGVVSFRLTITARQKELKFLVLGSAIDKTIRLSGVKKAKSRRPKPTQQELANGFWQAFKLGWYKRKEAEK